MQIQQANTQNFGARFISPATIKIKNDKGKWVDDTVSFIKLNTGRKADVKAIEDVKYHWDGQNLSGGVAEEVKILGNKAEVFALTTQTDNFERVNPKDILGIMSTDKTRKAKGNIEIFKIGSDPSIAYEQNHRQRPIKHVAKSMIQEFVRLLSKNKNVDSVVTHAEPSGIKFWDRVGFKQTGEELPQKYSIDKNDFSEFIG